MNPKVDFPKGADLPADPKNTTFLRTTTSVLEIKSAACVM